MKTVVLVASLFAASAYASACSAAEWWLITAVGNGDVVYGDRSSVSDFSSSGIQLLIDHRDLAGKAATYRRDVLIIDCKGRKFAQKSATLYDLNDSIIKSETLLPSKFTWRNVDKKSISEPMSAFACNADQGAGRDIFKIDDFEFQKIILDLSQATALINKAMKEDSSKVPP